ncbi:Gfo/Idh/MocA family oxidoreductase [Pseudaestuariivita sp.]|uniref:Gfo/Idh/MocA family oxidoreductase n=1 Tax=Pseudaestuariivita sp. TaxID=2211669 RepID=UPI00405A43E7
MADPVRLGVAGLGRGFMLSLPSLRVDPHVQLVACAAPRAESRAAFVAEFGGRAHETIESLAADPEVEAVYLATPHHLHRAHAEALAAGGKALLIDKPLAVTMKDAEAIVASAERYDVPLVSGPSHSFDPPVLAARRLIAAGRIGPPMMALAFNYTDFLYRPRRPEELDTAQGGGVLFSQAIHQIDVIRLLMGRRATHVTARTGNWDDTRPTEGAYTALIDFEGGASASLTYSGYAHFDSDVWMGGVGELGHPKLQGAHAATRARLRGLDADAEAALKSTRTFGSADAPDPAKRSEHFGPVIVSGPLGDLRLTPEGFEITDADGTHLIETPPNPAPRSAVFQALYETLRHGTPPPQAGAWGLASLEVVHAMLASAKTRHTIALTRQGA